MQKRNTVKDYRVIDEKQSHGENKVVRCIPLSSMIRDRCFSVAFLV